jgi:molybdate transport system regulatory protein
MTSRTRPRTPARARSRAPARTPAGRRRPAAAAHPRWRLLCGETIALGPGKADLLDAIAATGSISAAAAALGMSCRRAWMLADTMNRSFRRPLVTTSAHRSAGAALTNAGTAVVGLYRALEAASRRAAQPHLAALVRLLRPGAA